MAAARSNLSTGAEGFVGSTLEVLPPELLGHLDLIAAVPPYVPDGARHLMPHDTLAFEPEAAVLGGDDGLDVARVIITDAARWLAPGGRILLELHRSQVRMAAAHAREHGLRPLRRAVSADAQTGLFEARLGP